MVRHWHPRDLVQVLEECQPGAGGHGDPAGLGARGLKGAEGPGAGVLGMGGVRAYWVGDLEAWGPRGLGAVPGWSAVWTVEETWGAL